MDVNEEQWSNNYLFFQIYAFYVEKKKRKENIDMVNVSLFALNFRF